MERSRPSIGAVVALTLPAQANVGRRAIALAATLAIHGIVGVGLAVAPSGDRGSAPAAKPSRIIEMVAPPPPAVLEAPEPPPPAPIEEAKVAPPSPPAARLASVSRSTTPSPTAAEPPAAVAPSQTAAVVATDAAPEILDFTDFDIATGDARVYVGGVSSSAGENTVAARGDAVAADGLVGAASGGGEGAETSSARSVRLPGGTWDCPWPDDARALRDRVQEVKLRAVVGVDGRATSVEILSDPGHGFGAAALRCAKSARFDPALDAQGRAIQARSPPIRVRFTR